MGKDGEEVLKGSERPLLLHVLRFDVFEAGPARSGAGLYSGALFGFLVTALLLVLVHALELDERAALPLLLDLTAIAAFPGILSEIGATFLESRDLPLLATLPVSSASYFRARAGALGVALLLKALAFSVLPAAWLVAAAGAPWWAPAVYLLVMGLALMTAAALSVALFSALRRLVGPALLRDVLVWAQVIMVVGGTAVLLLLLRGDLDRPGEGLALWSHPLTPGAWFTEIYGALTLQGADLGLALLLGLVCTAVLAILPLVLGPRYLALLEAVRERPVEVGSGRRRRLLSLLEAAFVRADERAGFRLGLALLRRERTFRLQTYPLLAYPVLFLGFGMGQDDDGLFSLCFSHFATLTLPLAGLFLGFSDSPEAAWVTRFHGAGRRDALWAGTRKAFLVAAVLPLFAFLTVLLVLDRGLLFGLTNGLIALALAVRVALGGRRPAADLPFSQRFEGGLEAGKELGRVYGLFPLVVVIGFLQYAAWKSRPWLLIPLALAACAYAAWSLRAAPRPLEEVTTVEGTDRRLRDEGVSEPFPLRMRRELRALGTLYATVLVLALLICSGL